MTPQEQREHVALHMDADMQFVVSEAGVLLEHQVAISRYYGSLRKFGALADDRAGVRTACLQDFGNATGHSFESIASCSDSHGMGNSKRAHRKRNRDSC